MADLMPPGAVARDSADLIPPGAVPRDAAPPKNVTPGYTDDYSPVVGGVLDTLGLTKRPGARTPVDVLLNPKGVAEHAAQLGVAVPATVLAGEAAGLGAAGTAAARYAPAVGRALMGGLQSGAEAKYKGESPTMPALATTGLDLLTEGALSKTGLGVPILGEFKAPGAPARAFKSATEALKPALEAVKSRLPTGAKFSVPTLGKAPMTAEAAVEKLAKLEGPQYEQARAELVKEMNRLTTQQAVAGPSGTTVRAATSGAGELFDRMTSPRRFAPPTGARVAEFLRTNPAIRGLLETPIAGPIPAGAGAAMLGAEAAPNVLHYLRGAMSR